MSAFPLEKNAAVDFKVGQKLLEKATRVDEQGNRQLDQQQGITFANYPLAYEINFKNCLPLPVTSETSTELFSSSDTLASAADSRIIGAQKSYVIFDVCPTSFFTNPFDGNTLKNDFSKSSNNDCSGGESYILDLNTYMEIVLTRDEGQEDNNGNEMSYTDAYCEACAASYEFCQ